MAISQQDVPFTLRLGLSAEREGMQSFERFFLATLETLSRPTLER